MSQGWIIIVSDGDEARRFVVAEPLLDQAKSLVAQRVPSTQFVRSQQVPERLFAFLEMTRGDVIEWQIGARVWHPKRSTLAR